MAKVAIVARVRAKKGRVDDYLSTFAPLLEQVEKEPGTLVYLLQRSNDDPDLFWTSELYADEASFDLHRSSDVHAASTPVFNDLIAEAEVIVGEAVMGKGIG